MTRPRTGPLSGSGGWRLRDDEPHVGASAHDEERDGRPDVRGDATAMSESPKPAIPTRNSAPALARRSCRQRRARDGSWSPPHPTARPRAPRRCSVAALARGSGRSRRQRHTAADAYTPMRWRSTVLFQMKRSPAGGHAPDPGGVLPGRRHSAGQQYPGDHDRRELTKDAASTPNAIAWPGSATSAAPSTARPATPRTSSAVSSREFAATSSVGGTRSGMMRAWPRDEEERDARDHEGDHVHPADADRATKGMTATSPARIRSAQNGTAPVPPVDVDPGEKPEAAPQAAGRFPAMSPIWNMTRTRHVVDHHRRGDLVDLVPIVETNCPIHSQR